MIIEFFGPPGSGKTTMAQALADRLCDRGYVAKIAVCYQPRSKGGNWDMFGVISVVFRILSAGFSIFEAFISNNFKNEEISISNTLLKFILPESKIWRVRLWQYIFRLSRCWKQAAESADITIFDQGFVQAIGSLAMFNSATGNARITQALHFAPKADLAVRTVVPSDVVEKRLRARMIFEPAAERLFEADITVNMKSFRIFDEIGSILSGTHRNVISVQPVDRTSTFDDLDRVEMAVLSRLSGIEAPAIKRSESDQAPPWARRDRSDRSKGLPTAGGSADIAQPTVVTGGTAGPVSMARPVQRDDVARRLVHASVFALLVYIGGAGLTSMAQLGIARLVGATSYGIYSYALAWSTVLASLSMLGFNVSLLRFVPAYTAEGRLDLARGVITFALRWALLAATLAGLAGAGVVVLFSKHLQQELQATMLLGMAAVPLITAYALGATLVRAFEAWCRLFCPSVLPAMDFCWLCWAARRFRARGPWMHRSR
ncbi:hypothetical protein ACVDG5_000540 [Mesorhizobium sp. ORM6]